MTIGTLKWKDKRDVHVYYNSHVHVKCYVYIHFCKYNLIF